MVQVVDIDERVRQHVTSVVSGCEYGRVDEVQQFATGERHHVFKVSYADASGSHQVVVVRVGAADETRDCAFAEREARVLDLVAGRGAPRVVDFRCSSEWLEAPTLCLTYMPGLTKPLATLARSDAEALGRTIGGVHRVDVGPLGGAAGEPMPRAEYLARRLEQAVTSRVPALIEHVPVGLDGRIERASEAACQRVEAAMATTASDHGALVLLHGDPGEENVIWGPSPVLIDWEYARLGDPADEIAYTFVQNALDASRRESFLRGYRVVVGDGPSAETEARVATWEPLTLLGSALWWVERHVRRVAADRAKADDPSTRRSAEHYLRNATERLDRFERSLSGG
jgi:aminoglycoside phosphotransferase (APT) family kinase protein